MLLKKIESLESKVKDLVEKWRTMKEENTRLLRDNDALQNTCKALEIRLEEIKRKRDEGTEAKATPPHLKETIDSCIEEMEEGMELLRKYKNGI